MKHTSLSFSDKKEWEIPNLTFVLNIEACQVETNFYITRINPQDTSNQNTIFITLGYSV